METPHLNKVKALHPQATIKGKLFYGKDGWAVQCECDLLLGTGPLGEIAPLWVETINSKLPASSREQLNNAGITVSFEINFARNEIVFSPIISVANPPSYEIKLSGPMVPSKQ